MRSNTADCAPASRPPVRSPLWPPLPLLATFARRPSWVNRAGRIDRSACIELRASDIWRHVPPQHWRAGTSPCRAACGDRARSDTPRCPARGRAGSPRSSRGHCEASATFTITAPRLAALHDSRVPRSLAGDWRTAKSNAMKHEPPDSPGDRAAAGLPLLAGIPPLTPNPNRGASRSKILALWAGTELDAIIAPACAAGWSQTVILQRWRLHDRLAQHFLICPRCPAHSPRSAHSGSPRGTNKTLKLFMPLASVAECDDAEIAEGWVRRLDALALGSAARVRITPQLMSLRAKLIERYGLLFRGPGAGERQLVCRRCLGLRYGEVKWQRQRESKAIARRAAALEIAQARERAQRDARNAAEDAAHLAQMRAALDPETLAAAARSLREERMRRQRRARANQRRNTRRAAQRQGKSIPKSADHAAREGLAWLNTHLGEMRTTIAAARKAKAFIETVEPALAKAKAAPPQSTRGG